MSGKFPEKWKFSSIVPISKASDRASPSNDRQISLLPVVSKMLECHFHHLIANYLSEHHPLVNTQWGVQSGKSTVTGLLATTYDWFTHLEASRDVGSTGALRTGSTYFEIKFLSSLSHYIFAHECARD